MKRFFKHAIVKNASAMIGGSSLQAVFGFITNLILVRYISPDNFGVFALVLANAYLLSSFFNLRIGELIIRDSKEELTTKFTLYNKYVFFQSGIVTLFGFLILYWSNYWNNNASLLLIAMFLNPIVNLEMALFERKMQYSKIAIIESTANITGHIIAIIGVFLGWGILVLYLRILTQPIIKVIGLLKINEFTKLKFELIKFKEIQGLAKTAKGFWFDAIAEQTFDRMLYLLIGQLLPIQIVGYFYQAKLFVGIPHRLFSSFSSRLSFNYLSHKDRNTSFLWKVLKLEAIILIPIAIISFFWAKEIIQLLYGDDWIETSAILKYMSPLIFFFSLFSTLKVFHMAKKRMSVFLIWGRLITYIVFISGFLIINNFSTIKQAHWLALVFALSYAISCFSLMIVQRKLLFSNLFSS